MTVPITGTNTIAITPGTIKLAKSAAIITANTNYDGTGTTYLTLTGGAAGSRIDKITVSALGTNAATSMRFFINDNGGVLAANNQLVHDITLASTTASPTSSLTVTDVTITRGANAVCPIPYIPPNYKLNIGIGTAGTAGWQVSVYYGDY